MKAWTCTLFISKKIEKIICEILPMERFSTSFEEHMTLNCIKNLWLHIYQMTCKYRLDFFKGSTHTLPIFQKYFPPFPLGLFYWYVVELPSKILKPTFYITKRTTAHWIVPITIFLTDLHLLATSWNGSELKKRKSK